MIFAVSFLSLGSLVSFPLVKRFGPRALLFGVGLFFAVLIYLFPIIQVTFVGESVSESLQFIPSLKFEIIFYADALRVSFAILTLLAGGLILIYSAWYFDIKDQALGRFSAFFIAFGASMLGLIFADNFYLLFVFWEATTILSFLLIGHQHRLRASRSAALQALIVTTFGGLAMLVGLVLLHANTGVTLVSELTAQTLQGSVLNVVAIFLVLLGALTKSAIFPFHFWLPDAMAAPTPVSAYLHAAAMVKAGVLIVVYLSPHLSAMPWVNLLLLTLGGITMLWGGYRSLQQFDLKLLVAHSTVSQLGMLIMLLGFPSPEMQKAGIFLVFTHAVAKAPLFLTVGIIDHRYGTRDIRELSGVGKKFPALFAIALLAAASLAGVFPLVGFLAKESALTALLQGGSPVYAVTLVVFILGSILTAAYMARFILGSFSKKKLITATKTQRRESSMLLVAPAVFAGLALTATFMPAAITNWARVLNPQVNAINLWHGFTPELYITVLILVSGIVIGFLTHSPQQKLYRFSDRLSFSHGYWKLTHLMDLFAVRITAIAQRGSLPWYLAVILVTFIVSQWATGTLRPSNNFVWAQNLIEIPLAVMMIVAAIRAASSTTRFKSVVLVGVTGYAMVALFAILGAPDLAITQALVETVTLITFILVIRKLPIKIATTKKPRNIAIRLFVSISAAVTIALLALLATGARNSTKISEAFAELAYTYGHGLNIVNVTLVDIRAWDTMGELSVIVAAATGVASLIFVISRTDNLPRLSRKDARINVQKQLMKVLDPNDATRKGEWILSGSRLDPVRRSIILEVVVRLTFHALMILSVFLLLSGHNAPGGGFAGGLVAGLALAARYLAGGRHELGAAVNIDAGKLLGFGLFLAVGTAIAPMFWGQAALTSNWLELDLGILGELSLGTSTIFDVGVYFVVFGLVLDVLRSLGSKVDEESEQLS